MTNINDTYFDGYYKDIWKMIIPNELTVKEVDFMVSYFNLQPGMKVLDLMCGYGRHSIALAERGLQVTSVDNLEEYIKEVKQTAENRNLPINAVKASIVDYEIETIFDLVICMGNSLNFFDSKNVQHIFKKVSNHLANNGHFLINSWSIAEIVFKNFQERSWSEVNGKKFLTSSKLFFHPTRIETEHLILDNNQTTERKNSIDYIYSIAELDKSLNQADLYCKEIYSVPGRKKFILGEPRIYIIANKGSTSQNA